MDRAGRDSTDLRVWGPPQTLGMDSVLPVCGDCTAPLAPCAQPPVHSPTALCAAGALSAATAVLHTTPAKFQSGRAVTLPEITAEPMVCLPVGLQCRGALTTAIPPPLQLHGKRRGFCGTIAPVDPRMCLWQNTGSSSVQGEVLGAGSAMGSDGNYLAGAGCALQWCDATGRLLPELPPESRLASALPF